MKYFFISLLFFTFACSKNNNMGFDSRINGISINGDNALISKNVDNVNGEYYVNIKITTQLNSYVISKNMVGWFLYETTTSINVNDPDPTKNNTNKLLYKYSGDIEISESILNGTINGNYGDYVTFDNY